MKTEIGGPEVVTITASGNFTSGTGLLTGQMFGVPQNSGASGDLCQLKMVGKVTLAKTGSLAVAVGDVLYWDDTNKVVNKTSSAQKEVGYAISATGSGAGETLIDVYLVPTPRTSVAA
jgi:predicted RecA/RadA family phage recombinase